MSVSSSGFASATLQSISMLADALLTNLSAAGARPPPVTLLKFVGHDNHEGANATLVSRRRRLALRDGVKMEGNLHTLGYFAADICVGTPPKVFNLIVGARSSTVQSATPVLNINATFSFTCSRSTHGDNHTILLAMCVCGRQIPALLSWPCRAKDAHTAGITRPARAST